MRRTLRDGAAVVGLALAVVACGPAAGSPPVTPIDVAPAWQPGTSPAPAPSPPASPSPPVAAMAPASLTGMIGERPWTARRAYLLRVNEGARATTSSYPGQEFLIVESTIVAFDEDVTCDEIPADITPTKWHAGKHYLQITFSGEWPLAGGTALQTGARWDKPTDLRVQSGVYLGGSYDGQGFTGPLRVVSTHPGKTVLALDLSSPNRFGPNHGDLRGTLEVVDCIKQRVWAKPPGS